MWSMIDGLVGREGFRKLYGYYPRVRWHAYLESVLRLIYYIAFTVAAVMVVVAMVDQERLTVGWALILVGLAGFAFKGMHGLALLSIREQLPENNDME